MSLFLKALSFRLLGRVHSHTLNVIFSWKSSYPDVTTDYICMSGKTVILLMINTVTDSTGQDLRVETCIQTYCFSSGVVDYSESAMETGNLGTLASPELKRMYRGQELTLGSRATAFNVRACRALVRSEKQSPQPMK